MSNFRSTAACAMLGMVLLTACGTPKPADQPAAAPAPAESTTAGAPTQPAEAPAAATISFDGRTCAYDGPDTLPAGESLDVTWKILTKVGDIYALLPILTDQRMSPEDLMLSLKGIDPSKPVLPAGFTVAGHALSVADRTVNVVVKAPSGTLSGLLYFACADTDAAFQVLGPYELK